MIKFDTVLRLAYTLGVYLALSPAAAGQSVLNFPKATVRERLNAGFAVTNPTPNYADVQFTYYGSDGSPITSGIVNPVRYRVAPKGQISMRANEVFAGSNADGWVQVTSEASGLTGYYLAGDFATMLEGSESAAPLTTQVIPLIREDQRHHTELVILNPGTEDSSVSVTLYNRRGEEVLTSAYSLSDHAAIRLQVSSLVSTLALENLAARISSSLPVAALGVIQRDSSLLFVPGQPVDAQATVSVASHFISGGGFDPILVLQNPTGSVLPVTVTLFGEQGRSPLSPLGGPASRNFTIPPNGSISVNTVEILGRLVFAPSINGWLRIESPNGGLNGLLILDRGQNVTVLPLQKTSLNRGIYTHIYEEEPASTFTGFAFVNPSSVEAVVEMILIGEDGLTIAENTLRIAPESKISRLVRDTLPESFGRKGNYIVVQSSEPLYGVQMVGSGNAMLASVLPALVPAGFVPNPIVPVPAIVSVEPGFEVRPGTTLRISVSSLVDAVFLLGDAVVVSRQLAPGIPSFNVDVPAIEPGFANLRVRSNGIDSAPVRLRILPADDVPTQDVSGRAFYQKVDLIDSGLDLSHPVMVPIRHARIELVHTIFESIIAVSETDGLGRFTIPVPFDSDLSIRVVSSLRGSNLRVADNTNLGAPYVTAVDLDGRDSQPDLLLAETSRSAGAFNILEVIQRANQTLKRADPALTPPAVTIFWSTRNTNRYGNAAAGFVGTSHFNIANNAAYILGDRATDSDEFDDPVIIHEYAHLLAARFSRDDSPGGAHILGDMLDPRVAWSEGWADFFSSVVRNDRIWRDSGPNGALAVRYDLEDNVPRGDNPGYWSEASVATILWDLLDDHSDTADSVAFPLSLIWNSFTDLRTNRFVYLPYFLERFLTRNPSAAAAVQMMAQSRSIDIQPDLRPSTLHPFPTPMTVGSVVTGFVDSVTTRRSNLMTSSHFYSFTTRGGAASLRLDITGLGAGSNANANDLDVFLMDSNGRLIGRSDSGLNGQSERIALTLPAGVYVVEIRSFYSKAETGEFVFNSGQYQLGVSVQ